MPGFKSALISVALIQDLARAGKFDAALATARDLPDDRLMSVTAPMLRAWLALGASGQQAALDELKPLEAINGADMLHQVQTALIYDYEGEDAKAVESLQKAIDSATQMPAQLAEIYVKLMLRQGKPDAAREMVERFRAQAQGRGEDVASAMLRQIEAGKRNGPVVADVKEGMAIAYGEIAMELMADDFSGDACG